MPRQIRKLNRRFKKLWRRKKNVLVVGTLAVAAVSVAVASGSPMNVNYTGLLSLIAQGESRGNYNAYFGNAANDDIDFINMTVAEVLDWQHSYLQQGSPSNAVGKYQFIRPTLEGLVNELGIDPSAKFDAELQDRLAVHLLKRRDVDQYLRGQISREQFAHNLSMEWASLPRVLGDRPEASYYASDGLNHVQVSLDDFIAAIETLRQPKKG